MSLGQISFADEDTARDRKDRFIGLCRRYIFSEEELVLRWSAKSVWLLEAFHPGDSTIMLIDLSLPTILQFYQLGQQIGRIANDFTTT